MLGVHRKHVTVVDYDPAWPDEFAAEKKIILEHLDGRIQAIEHVGSTAVPGMSAKPVLDMLGAIDDVNDYESFIEPLAEIGYKFAKDSRDIRENVLFVKGEGENRTHHLKLLRQDAGHWHSLIHFRNYLIAHPDIAAKYQKLKRELAKKYGEDRESYTAAKAAFIENTLRSA